MTYFSSSDTYLLVSADLREEETHVWNGSGTEVEKHLHSGLCFKFVHKLLVDDRYIVATSLVEEDTKS